MLVLAVTSWLWVGLIFGLVLVLVAAVAGRALELGAVVDRARPAHEYVTARDDVRAEVHVAVDLEAIALDERRRARREARSKSRSSL